MSLADITKDNQMWINGRDTVKQKAAWASRRGLAGVMAWEAGQDTLGNSELSLLAAIAQELHM
jgi:GH18 family chitinase